MREPVTSIPKWIPKLFLSASSKVLLERIGAFVRDVRAQEPILQATQQNNQPASGFTPHGTQVDPMTRRGGPLFQGHPARPRSPRISRGPRGRGRGYQAQSGYGHQVLYTPIRNSSQPRARGSQRIMHSSNSHVINARRPPTPSPTSTTTSQSNAPNVAEGLN